MAKPQRPFGLNLVAVLLLLLGAGAIAGFVAYAHESRLGLYDYFGVVEACVMVATAMLILFHHKYAVSSVLLCAITLIVDRAHELLAATHGIGPSFHALLLAGRALLNVALYLAAYEWFRRWRIRIDNSPQTQSGEEWWPTKSDA